MNVLTDEKQQQTLRAQTENGGSSTIRENSRPPKKAEKRLSGFFTISPR
jgi:hypothetical protein